MTIQEAISRLDEQVPNTYTEEEKINWLNQLDSSIKTEIIDTHINGVEFTPYTTDTPRDTELLVPSPYDDIYLRWMDSQIAYNNNEFGRYNASISLYNNAYSSYERFYNRNNMPKGKHIKYWGEKK